MTEADESLNEIGRQRTALAQRVRLPWWFLVLFGMGWTALLTCPTLFELEFGILAMSLQFVSVLLVCSPLLIQHKFTGVRLDEKPLRRYPSYRRGFGVYCAILVLGLGTVMVCGWNQRYVLAFGVAVIAGVLAACTLRYMYLGIARDIARGTAA